MKLGWIKVFVSQKCQLINYIYLSQELTVDHDMDPVHVGMYIRNSISFNVRNDLPDNALKFPCVEIFLILKWYRPSKGLFIWPHLAGTR